MKFFIVLVVLAIGASASLLPLPKPTSTASPIATLQCINPTQFSSTICNIVPAGCMQPLCAVNTLGNKAWFTNGCNMLFYNIRCGGRYQRTLDTNCPISSKPVANELPCPFPQMKPKPLEFN